MRHYRTWAILFLAFGIATLFGSLVERGAAMGVFVGDILLAAACAVLDHKEKP